MIKKTLSCQFPGHYVDAIARYMAKEGLSLGSTIRELVGSSLAKHDQVFAELYEAETKIKDANTIAKTNGGYYGNIKENSKVN